MRIRRLAVAGAVALLGAIPASAHAIGIGAAGGGGAFAPAANLGACATLSFAGGGTFVGQFTGVGEVQGPGTQVGTIRGSIPIVVTNGAAWHGCIPGAYNGATAGEAKFTLTGNGTAGDYASAWQCTVLTGVVTCH